MGSGPGRKSKEGRVKLNMDPWDKEITHVDYCRDTAQKEKRWAGREPFRAMGIH